MSRRAGIAHAPRRRCVYCGRYVNGPRWLVPACVSHRSLVALDPHYGDARRRA